MTTGMDESKMQVYLPRNVWHKIMHWVDKSPVEISGLGTVRVQGNYFVITDAFLLDQENSATSTDIDPAAVCKLEYDILQSGNKEPVRFWWHSHVNMACEWSGTDDATMLQLAAGGWFVSGVFNKKREYKCAVTQGKPFTMHQDGLPLCVEPEVVAPDLKDEWTKEFETKCKETKWAGTSYSSGTHGQADYIPADSFTCFKKKLKGSGTAYFGHHGV